MNASVVGPEPGPTTATADPASASLGRGRGQVVQVGIETVHGVVGAGELGVTLMHEHLFVLDPELERNDPHPEWDESLAIEEAIRSLNRLHAEGVGTVVDLTVPGLGRFLPRVRAVADRVGTNIVVATGYYTDERLPKYFHTHGPGRLVDGPDPLERRFVEDIRSGIAGTESKAAIVKVASDRPGITDDVGRVMRAAAVAHQETGVPIATHTNVEVRGGEAQQDFFRRHNVPLDRVIIGHCGDTTDVGYLRGLMDNGSTIGMDRFGMEHVLDDPQRLDTLLRLLESGYQDRIVISQDAAFFSAITPPSWRARRVPNWNHFNITRNILPALRTRGVPDGVIHQVMVVNPARLLNSTPTAPCADVGVAP